MPSLRHVDTCFGCTATSPTALGIRVTSSADGAEGRVRFDDGSEGAPGLVHGGLLATLADEVMGYGAARRQRGAADHRADHPVPAPDSPGHGARRPAARSTSSTDRRFHVHAEISRADDGTVVADADATYVVIPRKEQP